MIKKLKNSTLEVAELLHEVFQASYKVEALLLNANDFPPLKRSIENYMGSTTSFFGYHKKEALVSVIEIEHNAEHTYINSLVVHPNYFRQGIATHLMEFVLKTYDSNLFFVETGVENLPATNLYKSFGFVEVKQWNTDHGIRKVKFEKHIPD